MKIDPNRSNKQQRREKREMRRSNKRDDTTGFLRRKKGKFKLVVIVLIMLGALGFNASTANADFVPIPQTSDQLYSTLNIAPKPGGKFTARQVTENGWTWTVTTGADITVRGPACLDLSPDQLHSMDGGFVVAANHGPSWWRIQVLPDQDFQAWGVISGTVYWYHCPEFLGAMQPDGTVPTIQIAVNISGNCNLVNVVVGNNNNVGNSDNVCNTTQTTNTTTTQTVPQQPTTFPASTQPAVSQTASTGSNGLGRIPKDVFMRAFQGTSDSDWTETNPGGIVLALTGWFYNGKGTFTVPSGFQVDTNQGTRRAGEQATGPFSAYKP